MSNERRRDRLLAIQLLGEEYVSAGKCSQVGLAAAKTATMTAFRDLLTTEKARREFQKQEKENKKKDSGQQTNTSSPGTTPATSAKP